MSNPSTFHWTYEDYVRLTGGDDYFEFIDGERFVNPVPTTRHQMASWVLEDLLSRFLSERGLGRMFHAPLDVVFADDTVLQPDIVVILNERRDRIRDAGIFGAPDFVIEVLSPSTASRDRREKLGVYARYGVREFWLVDPKLERIEVFILESGNLVKKADHASGKARSLVVLPGFAAPLADVFQRP
jgi:Uma2 family endonuclease